MTFTELLITFRSNSLRSVKCKSGKLWTYHHISCVWPPTFLIMCGFLAFSDAPLCMFRTPAWPWHFSSFSTNKGIQSQRCFKRYLRHVKGPAYSNCSFHMFFTVSLHFAVAKKQQKLCLGNLLKLSKSFTWLWGPFHWRRWVTAPAVFA